MKRTKRTTKFLRAIAKDLPRQEYVYAGSQSENGEDIIQRGITKDSDGLPIISGKRYFKKIPLQNQVNHENRLKSAWDSNGMDGIISYLKGYVKPDLQAEFFDKLKKALA